MCLLKVICNTNSPMNLESFKAGTVTFLVSKARNAPNTRRRPANQRTLLDMNNLLICRYGAHFKILKS